MNLTRATLFFSLLICSAQERFESGDLKGFTKSPTEHIIEQLDNQVTVRSLEGTVVSKSLAQPLERVLVEVRGPGVSGRVRSVTTDRRGHFKFKRLPEGDYAIKITLNGFRSVIGKITVRRSVKDAKPLQIEMFLGV